MFSSNLNFLKMVGCFTCYLTEYIRKCQHQKNSAFAIGQWKINLVLSIYIWKTCWKLFKLLRVIDGPSQLNTLTLVDIFNAINLHLLNVVANIHQSPNHHKDSKLPGNKYCLIIITVIDLTGRDLWFTMRFWIFTTEFFVIIELFEDKIKI